MNTATDSGQRSGAAIVMLDGWLRARLPSAALAWFGGQLEALMGQDGAAVLARALGQAPRRLGRDALQLSAAELAQAGRLRPGLEPAAWRIDQAARIVFVLAAYGGQEARFAERLDVLADTAEINEAIALYRGFPLYPAAEAIEHRAREAVRSSMRPVYEAIAHRNPYPVEHFDEGAWNQMVVKSFFLDSPLWPVQGLEQRANPALAQMLLDLAHERWAAGRAVSPELWRCVAPHADGRGHAAMLRVLESGTEMERLAVALSLRAAGGADAGLLRAECRRQGLEARAAQLSWSDCSPHPTNE
ncbi:EboA domain-containing protein [Massilia sp. erpn]|uniref:EboA domain-containing protein n=1 Tax=Massilia sp. erpn TaxID=2738142 RepID=UPI00210727F1|nr:EboA domain-containing protein [Massilia sp. erpn]UTY59648.1 EboA domain-containing protein [Massilia sp. erpn]